jgi:hypothetical protein
MRADSAQGRVIAYAGFERITKALTQRDAPAGADSDPHAGQTERLLSELQIITANDTPPNAACQ